MTRSRFHIVPFIAATFVAACSQPVEPHGATTSADSECLSGTPFDGRARTFGETGQTVRGIFLDYMDRTGGVAGTGLPLTTVFQAQSDDNHVYATQCFERRVLEFHPNEQCDYQVLGRRLGASAYNLRYGSGAPAQREPNDPGSVSFDVTHHRVSARFKAHWDATGGLAQNGYPISGVIQENERAVQYFERAVFEDHPENAAPWDIEGRLLGKDDPDCMLEQNAVEWPNAEHAANSDPWLAQNHAFISKMRPRVLAINFDNDPTARQTFVDRVTQTGRVIAESSRYHGYSDPQNPVFVDPQVRTVDLADDGWTPGHGPRFSSNTPVQCDSDDRLDYGALLGERYVGLLGIADPDRENRNMTLGEAISRGIVNDVWIHIAGDPDPYTCPNGRVVPDMNGAEVVEMRQRYGDDGQPLAGQFQMDGAGLVGNGSVPPINRDAFAAVGRTVRMLYVNSTRGPSEAVHSLDHGFERMATGGSIPALVAPFERFANFDLDTRLGFPVATLYANDSDEQPWIRYPDHDTIDLTLADGREVVQTGYDQGCGSTHYAPNSTKRYDHSNDTPVLTTCEHFGMGGRDGGGDSQTVFTAASHVTFDSYAGNADGGWQMYMRQSFPGRATRAAFGGRRLQSWWVYLYY